MKPFEVPDAVKVTEKDEWTVLGIKESINNLKTQRPQNPKKHAEVSAAKRTDEFIDKLEKQKNKTIVLRNQFVNDSTKKYRFKIASLSDSELSVKKIYEVASAEEKAADGSGIDIKEAKTDINFGEFAKNNVGKIIAGVGAAGIVAGLLSLSENAGWKAIGGIFTKAWGGIAAAFVANPLAATLVTIGAVAVVGGLITAAVMKHFKKKKQLNNQVANASAIGQANIENQFIQNLQGPITPDKIKNLVAQVSTNSSLEATLKEIANDTSGTYSDMMQINANKILYMAENEKIKSQNENARIKALNQRWKQAREDANDLQGFSGDLQDAIKNLDFSAIDKVSAHNLKYENQELSIKTEKDAFETASKEYEEAKNKVDTLTEKLNESSLEIKPAKSSAAKNFNIQLNKALIDLKSLDFKNPKYDEEVEKIVIAFQGSVISNANPVQITKVNNFLRNYRRNSQELETANKDLTAKETAKNKAESDLNNKKVAVGYDETLKPVDPSTIVPDSNIVTIANVIKKIDPSSNVIDNMGNVNAVEVRKFCGQKENMQRLNDIAKILSGEELEK